MNSTPIVVFESKTPLKSYEPKKNYFITSNFSPYLSLEDKVFHLMEIEIKDDPNSKSIFIIHKRVRTF